MTIVTLTNSAVIAISSSVEIVVDIQAMRAQPVPSWVNLPPLPLRFLNGTWLGACIGCGTQRPG